MRDIKLDVLRCGMNYMIVLLHAWAAYQYVNRTTIEFKSWTFVLSHLCWLAIPTFFLISGYLFFNKFSIASWPNKMWRRVKRLAVPYLVWGLHVCRVPSGKGARTCLGVPVMAVGRVVKRCVQSSFSL